MDATDPLSTQPVPAMLKIVLYSAKPHKKKTTPATTTKPNPTKPNTLDFFCGAVYAGTGADAYVGVDG